MCYRCQVCNVVVEAGVPQRRHSITRVVPARLEKSWNERGLCYVQTPQRTDIVRELAVCEDCHAALGLGLSLSMLLKQQGKPRRMLPAALQPSTMAAATLGPNLL